MVQTLVVKKLIVIVKADVYILLSEWLDILYCKRSSTLSGALSSVISIYDYENFSFVLLYVCHRLSFILGIPH
ncbi:hypothetical protein RO3G_17447 [Rhizopus delemar RA 99-880]|uniref:Uncharacterized protein n=1 Tax=Rhizopus delemar (strain RA 99-880 / ATCC MYA-4621 / FGSC 9543 / NRRL 43880) TaxID=246409 RepID=I1CF39_RHIO9|nr:hypothetical protein RO3G_11780 [Rhizopus delemar RA 99-880]EIE92735.1 hypothetical protein RO3G_17447 [Rhizopus delemar RA 99-880]|eukprot:EIE87069.1 hypothetical protein RO3G_11780 [Rhizopus delemar RA 99-880]